MLPEEIREPADSLMVPPVAIPDEGINFMSVVSQLERELILRCLEKTGGNKRQAARLLQLEPHDAHRQAAAAERRQRSRRRLSSAVGVRWVSDGCQMGVRHL